MAGFHQFVLPPVRSASGAVRDWRITPPPGSSASNGSVPSWLISSLSVNPSLSESWVSGDAGSSVVEVVGSGAPDRVVAGGSVVVVPAGGSVVVVVVPAGGSVVVAPVGGSMVDVVGGSVDVVDVAGGPVIRFY